MNLVWSQFTRGFVSFLKDVLSPTSCRLAVEAWSAKIADWAGWLMCFYFAYAIAVALGSLQVKNELPLMFQLLSLSILLGFTSLLLAEFAKFKSLLTTQILRCHSLFSLGMAFFVAISIPFPLYFQIIWLIVFLIFCLVAIRWHPGTGGTPKTDQEVATL